MSKKSNKIEIDILSDISDIQEGHNQVIPIVTENEDELSENYSIPESLPILSLRSSVLFPGSITPITVGREKSMKLIRDVEAGTGILGAVLQKESDVEQPAPDDMYRIGTAARILKTLDMPNGNLTVILHGLEKIEINEYLSSEPYFTATVTPLKDTTPASGNVEFEALDGTEHTLLPDMIEVGSFIGMAAMTQSELRIRDVSYADLGIIPAQFARMGIRFEQQGDDIYIPQQDHYGIESFIDGSIMTIADAPWPGLTPDLLSIFLVVATQAKGSVLIHQKMFESRLFFVDKLIDMGAQVILCDPHRATVIGHDHRIRLRATRMTSPDIRAGVALLIAAMSAEGRSTIQNIDQIDRGYCNIDGRLNALGARITRCEECG